MSLTPSPTPTEAEIVEAAEIMLTSYDTAYSAIYGETVQAVANAKWAKVLEYIAAWPAVRDEANDIKRVGSIEFFEGTSGTVRLSFRNTLRALYGLDPLASEISGTQAAFTSVNWF